MKTLLLIVLAMCATWLLVFHEAPPVKASDDCPVTSVQYDPAPENTGKRGATVVFDCGAAILTIREPVWP